MTKQAGKQDKGRFSSQRKTEAVLRILKGEALDALSREYGVTAAKLSEWKEQFVQGGQTNLKSRDGDAKDEEVARLKAMVGDLTMRLELQREVSRRLEEKNPFPWRKPRP